MPFDINVKFYLPLAMATDVNVSVVVGVGGCCLFGNDAKKNNDRFSRSQQNLCRRTTDTTTDVF